jgi:hypothetical protein
MRTKEGTVKEEKRKYERGKLKTRKNEINKLTKELNMSAYWSSFKEPSCPKRCRN